MSAPLLHPISAKSPIEWARAEAAALDQHALRMEASHGPNTKGAPLCRSRAAALRWLVSEIERLRRPSPQEGVGLKVAPLPAVALGKIGAANP